MNSPLDAYEHHNHHTHYMQKNSNSENECLKSEPGNQASSLDNHQLHSLYTRSLSDASMVHHHSAHPTMHHLIAGQLKTDPHFNPSHHPFSINNIIAASSEAAGKAADMQLYEMSYAGAYSSPLSPLTGPGHASLTSDGTGGGPATYYHSAIYHTTPSI